MNEKKSRVLHKGRTANIKDAVLIGPDSFINEKLDDLEFKIQNQSLKNLSRPKKLKKIKNNFISK